jgi:hypothetical protein
LVEKGGRKGYIAGMEDAAENGKESSHSAHAKRMNEWNCKERSASLYILFMYLTSTLRLIWTAETCCSV